MTPKIEKIRISQIVAGDNDRTFFDSKGIKELADSIAEIGLAQPITLRPHKKGFQICDLQPSLPPYKCEGLQD